MHVTASVNCSHPAQVLELESGHTRLVEERTNEFSFDLDVDADETASFKVHDFSEGSTNYTVAVTAIRSGGAAEVWARSGNACISGVEDGEVEFDLTIVATPTSGAPKTGGGYIRVEPKSKPDR